MAAVPAHSPPSLRSPSFPSFPVYHFPSFAVALPPLLPLPLSSYRAVVPGCSRAASAAPAGTTLVSPKNNVYTVGDFMTTKENLHIVKPYTTADEVDDDWKLVGLVSDYDLLALDSISGSGRAESNMFPEVDSTWKTFNAVLKLLSKTNGRVVGDVMTPASVVVRESTDFKDAARILLETKYRRLPVVDAKGRLMRDSNMVGIITRRNVVRAALHKFRYDLSSHRPTMLLGSLQSMK